MTDLELLQAVRDKLTPMGAWIQEANARTISGELTWSDSEDAVCWCLMGAAFRVAYGTNADERLAGLLDFKGTAAMIKWNDIPNRTQTEVLARLDTAIARRVHHD